MTSGPTRYVKTREAQQAVEGHEVEIVQALGIRWQSGQRDHIDCPYPGHGGAKDWRLNAKGRAICTCTGDKTDTIFNVAMKVESLDFDAAKIRCMEILGRPDLIREKSGEGSGQATDAESLMRAPSERRDDGLPRAYLAHRLGIEPAAVLMPVTPAVGLRALGYFDPPKGKGTGKPVHVGDFPCAVFGQIDAEGRRHAHRIYLAPGGAGKADLGMTASGTVREAKKSAKRIGDESTAGRAVIWGDAYRAPWCIIAEGIETATAIAHAFRQEIATGAAYVAAGISANGIEGFAPWPETQRVTVAADRDEAVTISRPNPSRRGERAARRFGIRHHERLAVAYVLAGGPGTATDWLDIHTDRGSDAVRAGILDAMAFRPTAEEIAEEQRRIEEIDELARVERDYPLPEMDGLQLSYLRTRSGRVRVHTWAKGEDGELVPSPVASPFGVLARLRYLDQANAYGLRLVVEDMGGRRREIDVNRDNFARQAASDTRAMLFGAGLRTEGDGEHIAARALKAADPKNEIAVVRRPGWHDLDEGSDKFFVCPGGRIIGLPPGQALELSVSSRVSEAVAQGGTMDGWKAAIAAAAGAPRCEHWIIGAVAGFAAPLIGLLGLDTCGIDFSGKTSGGKTTAQRLAVSAWTRAVLDKRDSLLQSARATANGIEAMAARSNGTILALDELGHITGKELGRIIYSLASGSGKNRMSSDVQLRASLAWSTFVLLSSEKSLEERIRGDGGEWYGGMAVRIADVGIDGTNRSVDDPTMARILSVDRHYGHAGPAFVEALVAAGLHQRTDEIREGINTTARSIAGANGDGALMRAAQPFAILMVAGRLALRFGILPASVDVAHAVRWAWGKFQASTDAVALDPDAQAVANLRAWIAERWDTEIHNLDPAHDEKKPVRNSLGWYDETIIYIPAHRIVEAAGNTIKEVEIGRALSTKQLLAKTKDKDRFYCGFVPRVGPLKNYALKRSEFRSGLRDEPMFTVHEGGRR